MKGEKLTKNNYITLAVLVCFVIIAFLGGYFKQEWAENIYMFWSGFVMFCFIGLAASRARIKPLRPLVVLYTFNLLTCVALGWWWLAIFWIITHMCCFYGMHLWDLEHNPKPEKDKEEPAT